MSSDLLFVVGMNTVYSLPLILAWLYAVGAGGWLYRRSPGAGVCLMAAGMLELMALFLGTGSVIFDRMLLESLSYESYAIALFLRSVVRVAVLLVSHTLLLMGIYGWRNLE